MRPPAQLPDELDVGALRELAMVEVEARVAGGKILARQVVAVPPGGVIDFEIEMTECLPAPGEDVFRITPQCLT
jgi:hypothetical protein